MARCTEFNVVYIPPGFGTRYAAELGSDPAAAAEAKMRRHMCMWNRITCERKRGPAAAPRISEADARAFIKDLCGVLGAWAVVQIANEELEREVMEVFLSE